MDLGNLVESSSKEVNLSSLHHKEKKEMKKIFHIKIHVKKTKVDLDLQEDNIKHINMKETQRYNDTQFLLLNEIFSNYKSVEVNELTIMVVSYL